MSGNEVPVTVLFNYNATDEDELTVKKDDVLLVLAMYDDGWWLIKRGNNTGLVPANYLELNEELPKKSQTTNRAGRPTDQQAQPTGRSGNANSKSTAKNGLKKSSELAELKNLREEAEEKINALSLAIEKSKIDEENAVAKRKSPKPTRSTDQSDQSEAGDWRAPTNSYPLVSQQKQAPQKTNIQQVSLDPSSLKFISDIITERINYEFAVRDSRLMDRVKTMINSSTAPNSAILIRDSEDRNSHNNSNSLVSNLNTPHRVRPSSTSAAASSEPASSFANGSVHLSLMKPGQHPSKIPMRVSLPKINSNRDSNVEYGESLKPSAPKLIPRKPTSTSDARLPHLANRSIVPSTHRHDEREREREGIAAPSPHPSHVNSVIVESVPDGLQYPQCRSKVYGPSYSVEAPDPLPGAKLALHHVYGYDGDHNRHGSSNRGKNVLWADARRVVYPAAALVVVQEVSGDRRQGFFCGHSDDVTCLAVHPDRSVAASGQMGKECCVLVWEIAKVKRGMSLNRNVVKLKAPAGMRGISAVDFSGDGRFLLAVGIDDTRLLMIFDWKEGIMVASAKFGHSEVNQVRFNPYEFTPLSEISAQQSSNNQKAEKTDAQCRSCYNLISFGGKNIKFWTLKEYAAKDDTGLDSISTFKGRPLNRRKGEPQSTNVKFVLEGNLGVMSKNTAVPEYTSMLIVNDNMDPKNNHSGGNIQTMPKSRVFFGSSTGSIYIWQQLDDDKLRGSLDKVNNGGMLAAPIFAWQPKGRLLSVVTELHDSPIIEMDYIRIRTTNEEGDDGDDKDSSGFVERIISASSDGIVNVWLLNRHETNNALPLDHLGFLELHKEYARSVSWDPSGSSAILGTAENSVLLLSYEEELIQPEGNRNAPAEIVPKIAIDTLTQSHNGKVRKLALHPIIPSIVASISSDKVVRLWDFRDRALLTCFAVADVATAVTFSPDGGEVVLGNEKGEFSVYACESLASLVGSYPCAFTANDFNNAEWSLNFKRSLAPKNDAGSNTPNKKKPVLKKIEIQEIKFSPLGDIVALGCKDNLVHLLSARNGYKHTSVCKGHGAPIRTIDFSSDGAVLQSSDATREVMHYEVATGKRLLNAAQFRDAVWSTFTSVYGWSVQGVFNNSEGAAAVDSDINCVDRSADAKWLVTGGSNTVHNAIKLFNYPCLGDAVPSLHGGHTSPVLDVKILTGTDGTIEVASAGGNDSCMFQWRLLEYK